MNTEEWIEKVKYIQGDKYDYSESEYINAKTKIKISCRQHGFFFQTPRKHASGQGCPVCRYIKMANTRRMSLEKFKERANKIHNYEYEYLDDTFHGCNEKVKIKCSKHGVFYQNGMNHLSGCGCYKCGKDKTRIKLKDSKNEFIDKANIVFKGKYIYDKVKYINALTKVEIICPIHGSFLSTPNNHLRGLKCSKCANIDKSHFMIGKKLCLKTTKDFVRDARIIHGHLYDYSLVDYKGYNNHVKIICKKHGIFEQTPNIHIGAKSNCPKCNMSKGESAIRKLLNKLNIKYVFNCRFVDCINPQTKGKLRYDFYLPDYNLLIEYDGIHHFENITAFGNDLINVQKRDSIKNEYAQNKGISLLRISYKQYSKIKEMISALIENMKNKHH